MIGSFVVLVVLVPSDFRFFTCPRFRWFIRVITTLVTRAQKVGDAENKGKKIKTVKMALRQKIFLTTLEIP